VIAAPAEVADVDADSILSALSTRREGPTDAEVESRRATYGRNQVAHEKPPAWPVQAACAFASPGADTGREALVHSPVRDLSLNDLAQVISVNRLLPSLALLVAVASCGKSPEPRADTTAAMQAAHGATSDSAFAGVQSRGAGVMGVNQYTSQHVFETIPDGGRIILERPSEGDRTDVRTIRSHMHEIAAAFARGDFSAPGLVHAQQVPGTKVMASRAATLHYEAVDRPRGAEVRITTHDPAALAAVHEFLAFQRADHRAAGHEGMHQHQPQP
jgi:hypothetical protein